MTAQIIKMAAAQDDPNPDLLPILFEDFWNLYPRKVKKKDALVSWKRVKPENYPLIIRDLQNRKWPGREFTIHPTTYLNGERWFDEPDEDVSLGECCWNCNGTREPGKPKCTESAIREKNGVMYCKTHIGMVN